MSEHTESFIPFPLEELRTEASVLTPKQEQEIARESHIIAGDFLILWKDYMSENTRKRLDGIEKRIIFTDEETFPNLATHFNWSFGEENEADFEIRDSERMRRELFSEAGADYYADVISYIHKWQEPVSSNKEANSLSLYKKLLENHGDLVHKVFFGTASQEETDQVLESIASNESENLPDEYKISPQSEVSCESIYSNVAGAAFKQEGLILIKVKDRYETLNPKLKRKIDSRSFFIKSLARKRFNDNLNKKRVAHEMAHLLQPMQFV